MIDSNLLAVIVFMAMCLVLCTLPFVPAFLEWKQPSDSVALPVFRGYENDIDHFARRLHSDVVAKFGLGSATGYEEFDYVTAPLENIQWSEARKRLISCCSIESALPICSPQPLYVKGSITAGAESVFTALYATGNIELEARSKILNWAHADEVVWLAANSVAIKRISAGTRIELGEGVWFERLNAPSIEFGTCVSKSINNQNSLKQSTASLADISNVTQQTPSLYLVRGDCELSADAIYEGSLIVTGILTIGSRTKVIGDIKARKGLFVQNGASVQGAVTCDKYIHISSDASIFGPLLSETDIVLDRNIVIGLPESPTTVSAQNILVNDGVIVHGSIWAHDLGLVRQS